MSGQIFISYRREDSSASAARLFDILRNHLLRIKFLMDEKEERLDAERREERAPTVLVKATKEQPWQNSLGMKFVPVAQGFTASELARQVRLLSNCERRCKNPINSPVWGTG